LILRVAIGGDHNGFEYKNTFGQSLKSRGFEVIDVGPFELNPGDDYPDFAIGVGKEIQEGRADRGIVICGSGVGASVAATKLRGVRAAVCHDTYSAHQGVEHDDMNVLCIGSKIVGPHLANELINAFLAASFSGEERHLRRLSKVAELE
jgi:ribose 5-phosphate isomerase B